jgi:anaerobic selenocysteine-containing dehydrogenase
MNVIIEGGRIRRITGDPGHMMSRGSLCAKCALAYNGAWIDPEQRLLYPLKRNGPKGAGQFARVTWQQALGEIAGRLKSIIGGGSADKIIQTHYTGTCSAIAGVFPLRFFKRLGATEVDPDTVCNKAGHEALRLTIGNSFEGFDPRSIKDAACVVVWGANPSASAPHVHKHWLPEARGKRIVVDPIAHATAREADLFLQLRPGSDAALAFAMMHAVIEAGLADMAFIRDHTVGWDLIEPAVREMTPERGAAITDVPAASIRTAAKLYAEGPSLLWLGQGAQRQRMGGNALRAISALAALTGNMGKPGTGILYLNGPATRGVNIDYVVAPQLAQSEPKFVSHMDLASVLTDPARSSALFCWNNNIVASSPQQSRLRQALQREDLLHVVSDLFATDTVAYADYVLPAASFLEFDDVLFPYFQNAVSAVVRVVEAPGECLPNQEIFRRLAREMGYNEPELFESDEDMLDVLLRQSGWTKGFRALAEIGTFFPREEPEAQYPSLRFPTPSGKFEIASELAVQAGYPLTPFPHADEAPDNGKLRILSPASEWTMNSSYANDAKILRRLGHAAILLNPKEAASRSIPEGALVELSNSEGRLKLVASLSADVPLGVALVYKGRWPKLDATGANVNVLNPGAKTDLGESSSVHAVEADLRLVAAAG